MSVPLKFVLQQGPVLRGMGQAAFAGLRQRFGSPPPTATRTPELPGPTFRQTLPPRDPGLVSAYVRHVGGDPAAYRGHVPAHLFPQWALAMSGKLTEGLSYPLLAAMNGGCRVTVNSPLPANEPLIVTANLENIDDNGRRAILTQRFVTGTPSVPEAVVAHLFVYVPLGNRAKDEATGDGKDVAKAARASARRDQRARVPVDGREVAFWKLGRNAGLDFAKLTGDFNPVHWVPPWARAFGFGGTILHGFSTFARAWEGLARGVYSGDVNAIRELEVRFTRPLVLPAQVGLYVKEDRLWVGNAPGGPAYLEGRFSTR